MNVPKIFVAAIGLYLMTPLGAAPFVWGICMGRPFRGDDAIVRALGATSCRVELGWSTIESSPDHYEIPERLRGSIDAAGNLSSCPLHLLAYGHPLFDDGGYPVSSKAVNAFGRYAAWTTQMLKRPHAMVEIWNEWNYEIGTPPGTPPGDPESYVKLLSSTFARVKKADPNAIVIGGSMALDGNKDAWLERACRAGLLQSLDGLSFHPYSFSEPLSALRMPEARMSEQLEFVEATIRPFEKVNHPTPFFLTELGWSSVTPYGRPEYENQAKWLSRALFLARANARVRGVWIFCLRDTGHDSGEPSSNLGLLHEDGSPKPAFAAVRDTIEVLKDAVWVEPCRKFNDTNLGSAWAIRIVGSDSRISFAIWSTTEDESYQITIALSRRVSGVRQRLIGWQTDIAAIPAVGSYRFTITDMPLVVGPFPPGASLREEVEMR